MYSKAHLQSLGQALKERREDQGLSLEKVSEWTKISVDTLKAVEEAQVDRFPVYTYLRGFILAYAKAVGIDEKEIEKELKTLAPQKENSDMMGVSSVSSTSSVSSSPSDLIEKDIRLTPILLAILILVVLGSILVFSNVIKTYNKNPIPFDPEETQETEEKTETKSTDSKTPLPLSGSDEKEDTKADTEEEENEEENETDKQEEETDKEPDSTSDVPQKSTKEFEIIVKAVKTTEVVYQVDKEKQKTLSLKADQFEVLKGQKNIFIKTKDSDSIYIFYNGDNKGLFGPGGKKEKVYTPKDS